MHGLRGFFDSPGDSEFFFTVSDVVEEKIIEENFENVIKTVVRDTKWSPLIIGDLFFDDEGIDGILFWYYDIVEQIKQIPTPPKK